MGVKLIDTKLEMLDSHILHFPKTPHYHDKVKKEFLTSKEMEEYSFMVFHVMFYCKKVKARVWENPRERF